MEQLVLSKALRQQMLSELATGLAILKRAEVKYARQTTGGLARARQAIESCIGIVEPSGTEVMQDLAAIVQEMAPGPLRTRAEKALRSLRGRLSDQESALVLDLLLPLFGLPRGK